MRPESPAKVRARELVAMLRGASAPDAALDRQLNHLFHMAPHHRPTGDLGDARRLARRYRQWGMREYVNGEYGAYVECAGDSVRGFMWASHKVEPIALAIAALLTHIDEMQ